MLDTSFTALLSPDLEGIMYIGGPEIVLYSNWMTRHMDEIAGINCFIGGSADTGDRVSACLYDEENYTCEQLWSQMKDLVIRIGDV